MSLNPRISTPQFLDEPYLNLSCYKFVHLVNPETFKDLLKTKALQIGIKGSILLSQEGINFFLSGEVAKIHEFVTYLKSFKEFSDVEPKESFSSHLIFSRMIVKVKPEIITMGRPEVNPMSFTGKRLYPKELKQWYEEGKDFVIVDTRNTYEITHGSFKNSVHYNVETFKEFPEQLEKRAEELKDKTVVMFCTGGIRCEKATSLGMQLGIKDVYQLEGGILKYFEEVGSSHYNGDCFVFDGREAVSPSLESKQDIRYKRKIGELKLFTYQPCPFALRVRMVLATKHLPFQAIEVNPNEESESAEYKELLKLNPMGETPVLIHNGVVLTESQVITQYLDEEFSQVSPLTPESPERRARMRIWFEWMNKKMSPLISQWCWKWDELTSEQKTQIENDLITGLYHLQGALQRRPFLVSKTLTLADIHVFTLVRLLFAGTHQLKYNEEKLYRFKSWFDSIANDSRFKKLLA